MQQKGIPMPYYFVNKDKTRNPGLHHEVHIAKGCHVGDRISMDKRQDIGSFTNEVQAVAAAKAYYSDADGCIHCCPKAHKG